ncbi:XerC Integrase [uncultured Caudovirales phage]|uniref:Integrase n=1 Tax=uncultured Caudovirales phage TaxID=2100421 RepID=A0A6J5PGA8_9CAUD|nr:XerC Integrase [uncultured Caudovirales phage]CAB4168916.1 XerC Integrase [uncultured Caudovirales phage]CAB4180803.1 XerC Integrase [uncultured Caudovirales phage]CAB4195411.1 XerC Integrase [uncultured Caudovirales phage]CAB4221915.1 XerC Integrase [uncultured Caudovirales phage]
MKLSELNPKFRGVNVKSGRYYKVYYSEGKHIWEKLTLVADGLAALEKELDARNGRTEGGNMPRTVAKYLRHHLPTLSPVVRKEHQRMFDIIAKAFEAFHVDQVAPLDCVDFLDLFKGRSARQHYKYRMSAFFGWCVVAGLIQTNPLREVKVKGPVAHMSDWTDELFLSVRDRLEPMLRVYHDLSFLVQQRTTDIRTLERKQIIGDVIHFQPSKTSGNTGARVKVAITPQIRAVLDEAARISATYGRLSRYVIHTPAGTAYTRSGVYSAYRRADIEIHGKATGLNPKDLRPYAATTLLNAGNTIKQIQQRLAHATQGTTEIYIQQHSVPLSEIMLELPTR